MLAVALDSYTIDAASQGVTAERAPAPLYMLLGPASRFAPAAAGWEFRAPMPIAIEREEDGSAIALDELFGNYGQGATPSEALADLALVLVGYYRILESATDTREVFDSLSFYFGRA